MEHTYIVQFRQELELWQDDASFPTVTQAIEYASSEALATCEHEHRVVRAELHTLATFNAICGEATHR